MTIEYSLKKEKRQSTIKLIQEYLLSKLPPTATNARVDRFNNIVFDDVRGNVVKKKRFKILERVIRYEVQVDMSTEYELRKEWVRLMSISVPKTLNKIKGDNDG